MKKVFIIVFVLIAIIYRLSSEYTEEVAVEQPVLCDDYTLEDSVNFSVIQYRSWQEYQNYQYFCSNYTIADELANQSSELRNSLYVDEQLTDEDYWKEVYLSLYNQDKDRFQTLQDSLTKVGQSAQLDREGFARMVVAMVQDIPYQYVLPKPCTGQEASPCNGDVRFGLYSPVEFLYSMRGDCDTRTVLLYTLLKNFGYDPLIVNSHEYLHSMIALDVPSAGEDFTYKGRTYAFWETTNTGWLPGMLPPDMNNKSYWNVALDYEY